MVERTRENKIGKMAEEAFRRESAEKKTFKREVRCCVSRYRLNRCGLGSDLFLFPRVAEAAINTICQDYGGAVRLVLLQRTPQNSWQSARQPRQRLFSLFQPLPQP